MVYILLRQILIMAFLMAVGVGLMKKGMLSQQGCRDLGAILLNVVIPCVILKSYMIGFYYNNSDYLQKAREYGHFTGYKN